MANIGLSFSHSCDSVPKEQPTGSNGKQLNAFQGFRPQMAEHEGRAANCEAVCFLQNHSTAANVGKRSGNGSVWSMNVKETPVSGI